jgi:acyl carrier protein
MKGETATMEVSAQIRKFVIENFLFEDNSDLGEDTSFLENGIIDSTGVLELIDFLEKTFGIQVEDQEIVPENLDSISQVAAFIHSKLTGLMSKQAAMN